MQSEGTLFEIMAMENAADCSSFPSAPVALRGTPLPGSSDPHRAPSQPTAAQLLSIPLAKSLSKYANETT